MPLTTFLLLLGTAGVSAALSAAIMYRMYSNELDEADDAPQADATPTRKAATRPSESELDEDTMDPRAVAQAVVADQEVDDVDDAATVLYAGTVDDEDAATVLYADVDWEQLADDLF